MIKYLTTILLLCYDIGVERETTTQQQKQIIRKEENIMKIYAEKSLRNFEFWSGACDRVKSLTLEELDQIETILEDIYPDGMDETQINDFFWFEEDTIAEWLGYNSFEELEDSRSIKKLFNT